MKLGILSSNFLDPNIEQLGISKLASNRLRLNIAKNAAIENNINVLPLDLYNKFQDIDILLIGKFVAESGANKFIDDDGSRMIKWLIYIEHVKKRGAKIILDYTDNLIISKDKRSEFYKKVLPYINIITVPSEMMKKNIKEFYDGEVVIIEEPIEVDVNPIIQDDYTEVNALWFGHSTNLIYLIRRIGEFKNIDKLKIVTSLLDERDKNIIRSLNKKLTVEFYEWQRNFNSNNKMKCNICLIPSDINDEKKNGVSNNRLITAFAMGLVPAVSPIHSYKPYREYYYNLDENLTINKTQLKILNQKLISEQMDIIKDYTSIKIMEKWRNLFLLESNLIKNK